MVGAQRHEQHVGLGQRTVSVLPSFLQHLTQCVGTLRLKACGEMPMTEAAVGMLKHVLLPARRLGLHPVGQSSAQTFRVIHHAERIGTHLFAAQTTGQPFPHVLGKARPGQHHLRMRGELQPLRRKFNRSEQLHGLRGEFGGLEPQPALPSRSLLWRSESGARRAQREVKCLSHSLCRAAACFGAAKVAKVFHWCQPNQF